MLKKHRKTGCHILLLALLVLLLFSVCMNGSRATKPIPLQLTFQGEYSQDGGAWLPLDESTELSALDGELVLRGNFNTEIPEGQQVNFYLNHITHCIYVNKEPLSVSLTWVLGVSSSECSRIWDSFTSPGITEDDAVEIYLCNPHQFGNADAYSEFLDSFYSGSEYVLKTKLGTENLPYRVVGLIIMTISVGIISIALAFSFMRVSVDRQIWALGIISFCMGSYIALDTIDLSLWSSLNVFNTYAQQLSMMLAALELGIFFAANLSTKAEKAAQIAVFAEGTVIAVIAVLCMMGGVLIYDTLPCWTLGQMIICPVLLGCWVYEYWKIRGKQSGMMVSCALLFLTIMLDCINISMLWWPDGIITKAVFVLLAAFHLARGIRRIPASYQKAVQADKLKDDLKNSRIILAMSQIRTHFVFNILNAISGMCKYDPEKADRTVVRFARYLRTNIDIMEDDQIITFHSELRHLEDYVALEQIRFGEKIQFVTDITVDQFLIPPLVLQPIVENSIKHGLTPKPSGGTVTLRTWMEDNEIRIAVRDDGVGFETDVMDNVKSVGLKNVRFRLCHIMHGRMDIVSTPGEGTTVTISIPREEAEKCV